jgi:hypothetical protein
VIIPSPLAPDSIPPGSVGRADVPPEPASDPTALVHRVTELLVDRDHFGGRAFLIDEVTGASSADHFTALVSDRGESHHACECPDRRRHATCDHLAALRSLIDAGPLADPAERPGEPPVTEAEIDEMAERAAVR